MSVSVCECTTREETLRSLAVYNAVDPQNAVTEAEVAAFAAGAVATVDFLAVLDGDDVGSAVCQVQPQRPVAAFTLVQVLPLARRRGAGSALYDACLTWARAHGRELLETRIEADDETSLAFARRRGFVVQQRDDRLELDVARAAPERHVAPDGVAIVSLADRLDLAAKLYDVACEALPDIPGEDDWTPPPREAWVNALLAEPHPKEGIALAVTPDDDVVGYAKLRINGDVGSHGITGVKRAWRRRGIARALKLAQIDYARDIGLAKLRTANEKRNAPMRAINLALGYVPVSGRVIVRGPLAETDR